MRVIALAVAILLAGNEVARAFCGFYVARADTSRADRKQLVGLLPLEPDALLPEGGQLADGTGHVTSSYRSAELGRPFALALLKGGHARIGETVHVPVDGTLVPVEITGSVLVDPEGARRDG